MDVKMFGPQNLSGHKQWNFSPFHTYNGMNTGRPNTSYSSTQNPNRSGLFNQHQSYLSSIPSDNARPQFLRLDSTGERVPELAVSASPSVSVLPKPNMFNFRQQQNRELGFGQRYTNTRCTKNRRTPPRQTDIRQQGYPFHEFAMASTPMDRPVKFYSFHGDTQILNLAQFCPTNFNYNSLNRPPGNSPYTTRKMENTNEPPQSGMSEKNQSGPNPKCDSLCDALGKMTVRQNSVSMDATADVCSISDSSSHQVNSMDSGYDETSLPSPVVETVIQPDFKTSPHLHESSELDQTMKQETVCIEPATASAIPCEYTDSPTFLSTVIHEYVESDTDSELDVSDTFSFFDTDTDSDIDIGDVCSRSAEFDILSCFFPDDPFNPMNFNGTCNVDMARFHGNNNKRTSEIEDEMATSRKRVRFVSDSQLEEVHEEETSMACDYQEARCGPWEDYARGRERFKRRIMDLEPILSPCFTEEHRSKMWNTVRDS